MVAWTVFQTVGSDDNGETTPFGFTGNNTTEGEGENQQEGLNTSGEVGIKKGNVAPNFELETLNGEVVTLEDFHGEKIMLNFWATWCPPCRAEMPDMQKVYEDHDVTILAVNLTQTETNLQTVETFVDDFGLTFPILLDTKTEVADLYGIQPVPTSFLIDTEGRIANIAIGPMNEDMLIQRFKEMN